jgi:hypothetical protein
MRPAAYPAGLIFASEFKEKTCQCGNVKESSSMPNNLASGRKELLMAEIGKPERRRVLIPLENPGEQPSFEPSPSPAQPEKQPEREPV